MENGYAVKQLSSELLPDVIWLYNAVHEEKADEAQLRHKFNTVAFGEETIGFLAYSEDGKPAAYYGVFPVRLRCGGRVLKGAQSGNTMTHPAHQRKGLFTRLAQLTYNECRSRGIQLLYGIPNLNSYPGFVKLGWKTTGKMNVYSIPLQPSLVTKARRKISTAAFAKTAHEKLEGLAPARFFSAGIAAQGETGVQRDNDFFAYKKTPGNYLVELPSGKAMLQFSTYGILLGELFDVADFSNCWNELAELGASLGAYSLSFHVAPGLEPLYKIPAGANKQEGLPIIVLDLGAGCPTEVISLTALDYDTF